MSSFLERLAFRHMIFPTDDLRSMKVSRRPLLSLIFVLCVPKCKFLLGNPLEKTSFPTKNKLGKVALPTLKNIPPAHLI